HSIAKKRRDQSEGGDGRNRSRHPDDFGQRAFHSHRQLYSARTASRCAEAAGDCARMAAILAGCTTNAHYDANIYGSPVGQRVVGNKAYAYVTATNVWNEMDALPLADGHCASMERSLGTFKARSRGKLFSTAFRNRLKELRRFTSQAT